MKDRVSERVEMLGNDDRAPKALIDLSVTGAAFIHPAAKKDGTKLSVKIKDFTLDAVVVYCQERAGGFRVGVQFKNVPANIHASLKTMVDDFSRGVPLTCEIVEQKD
jgi:hypothetical protein